ncbi:MAG: endonuclease domain-containing protein [Patescibacteria group bacterium]
MPAYFFPYSSINIDRARHLRKELTDAERKLWYMVLRNRKFHNIKFVRQKTIDNFIIDFYAAEIKLAIEVDGDTHGERRIYDEVRTHCLNKHKIVVIRYTNKEIYTDINSVWMDLENKIKNLRNPTQPSPVHPQEGG